MLLIWLLKLLTSFNFFLIGFRDLYFLIVVLMGIIYLFLVQLIYKNLNKSSKIKAVACVIETNYFK